MLGQPSEIKGPLVADLQSGARVIGTYMVVHAALEPFRDKHKGHYLALTLADKSGQITAKVWDNLPEDPPSPGQVVKVAADVVDYHERADLRVNKIRLAEDDEYTLADFLPATDKNVDVLLIQLRAGIERITEPSLAALVRYFYDDPSWIESFRSAPGSVKFNHAQLGGLVEHTAEMLALAETMLSLYPQADPDLVRAGVLLCNIGKVAGYTIAPFISETDAHDKQGHILLGFEQIVRAQATLERQSSETGFDSAAVEPLKHLLAAQSGRLEWGSPVYPKTLEAVIVHGVESLSAKANALAQEIIHTL